MSEENQHRVRSLFNEALEIADPAQREAFLARICAEDKPLRQRLEKLLLAYATAGGFLANPPSRSIPNSSVPPTTAFAQPGTRIGRYKLIEQLGEGGCGIVFLAEQEEPVRRRVALKVIKLGMDTKSVIARFEAERQALAMMEHPSIARILDAGATDTGRPYFVMELVRGLRITDYCDQNQLSMDERIGLFIQVCQAVQHAHQKGIIHRDLKPSNILVSVDDGRPTIRIIDFGIAKATESRLAEETAFTTHDQIIGTPAYMSPEQATTTGLDIDTRSDIYSLGVLLYELLVGKTPFDPKELARLGWEAMRRTIREDQPMRPSTRLRSLASEELTSTVTGRQIDLPRLLSLLTGDLDWIVMKCLEKDRSRRYETANSLATDLNRFLSQEPVLARPPSAAYQLAKLVRRHKLTLAAAAAILAILMTGIVVSSLEAARAIKAERQQRKMRAESDFKLYIEEIYRANESIRAGNLGHARDLLEKSRPTPDQADNPDMRGWEWRYLWPQCQSDASYQTNLTANAICSLSASPDGKWLATGEEPDGGVSIFDLEHRQTAVHLQAGAHESLVAFSPVLPLLAYSGADSTAPLPTNGWVRFWDAQTHQAGQELRLNGLCNGLAFTADGKTLVTATSGNNGALTVWRIPEGKALANFSAPQAESSFRRLFALSRSGSIAAYQMDDQKTVCVFDLAAGQTLFTVGIKTNEEQLSSLALSPDATVLAMAAGHTAWPVRLYKVATGQEFRQLTGQQGSVTSLLFSQDGQALAGAGSDSILRIWKLSESDAASRPRVMQGHRDRPWSIALLPDQATLVTGSQTGEVCIWGAMAPPRRELSFTLPGRLYPFAFSTNGEAIFSLDLSGRCAQWRGENFHQYEAVLEVGPDRGDASFSIDCRSLAVAYTNNGLIRVFDLARQVPTIDLPSAADSELWMRFLPDGKHLVVLHRDGVFHEWDLATAKEIQSWQAAADVETGDISPDGRWCLSLGGASASSLYDLVNHREIDPRLDARIMEGAAFSPDGKLFAAVGFSRHNKVWDTGTWREHMNLALTMKDCHSVAFSPDSQRLAVGGGWDNAIVLCDVKSGQAVLNLAGRGSIFKAPQFSPDGNVLAALSAPESALHIWRAPSFQELEANERPRAEHIKNSGR